MDTVERGNPYVLVDLWILIRSFLVGILDPFCELEYTINAIFIEVALGARRTENQIFMSVETHL